MRILITYDLQSDHSKVKNSLRDMGWEDSITSSDGTVCYLPNTCLCKAGLTPQTAIAEVQLVVKAPNLERIIAVEFNVWWALVGKKL